MITDYRMGQDMSDSFGSIGEILETLLMDDYESLDSSERAKTQILMNKFSGQRAPFRDFDSGSQMKSREPAKGLFLLLILFVELTL